LEGITLSVYWYVVKVGKPVGPRDVMKGADLSSPSVAYRHLQKLEEMELLQKNEYGEYLVKRKINMRGFIWIGHRPTSKMLLYALTFMSILIIEVTILGWHYEVETYEFKVFFALLIAITAAATGIFGLEAIMQRRRFNRRLSNE
jgi:repressor of nif and glnA expression